MLINDIPIRVTASPVPDCVAEKDLAGRFLSAVIESSQDAMIRFGTIPPHVNILGTNVQCTTMRAHYVMPLAELLEANEGDPAILAVAIPKVSREFQARYIALVVEAYYTEGRAEDPAAHAYQEEHGTLDGFPGAREILSIQLEGREGFVFYLFPILRDAAGKVTGFGPDEAENGDVRIMSGMGPGLLHAEGERPDPGDPDITVIDPRDFNPNTTDPGDLPN